MLEVLYRLGFFVAQWRAKRRIKYRSLHPVISVGNLSVGGTGKSVVVSYIVNILPTIPAIFLRGYKGSNAWSRLSRLVSDGSASYCDVVIAGDEAIMFAGQTKAIVVVGKNRARSAQLLEGLGLNPSVIILDDAYQHHTLHKNLEILLLDARWPFENSHCLPAGRLREKDCSRADCVLLTHCELLPEADLAERKKEVFAYLHKQGKEAPVLCCEHVVQKLENIDGPVVVLAGIGSFKQFVESVERQGVCVVRSYDMGDHAHYSQATLKGISFTGARALVTTAKDAVKLQLLAKSIPVPIHVLSVSLGFKYPQDKKLFHDLIKSCISNA